MQRISSLKSLLVAAVGFGALAAGSAAHARTDVFLSIGVPFGYVQPAPVYVQPRPVYVQPQPVYVQPQPVYVQPRPIGYGYGYHRPHGGYQRSGAWGDADRDGIPNAYDRNPYGRDARGGWGDRDRDGVPNRYDRAPGNPYRR